MNNAITKSAIVAAALGLLWDGIASRGYYEDDRLHRYGCHAVSEGHASLTGGKFEVSRHNEVVQQIHTRITQYIGGYGTAYGYMVEELGRVGPEDDEVQAFRKKMLEDLLAEYQTEELIASVKKSDILKEAKKFLATDNEHYMQPRVTTYICHSVSRAISDRKSAYPSNDAYREAMDRLEDELRTTIETRLGTGTFTGAISNLLGEDFADSLTYDQIQAFRHKWLDALTSEYMGIEA